MADEAGTASVQSHDGDVKKKKQKKNTRLLSKLKSKCHCHLLGIVWFISGPVQIISNQGDKQSILKTDVCISHENPTGDETYNNFSLARD